MRNKKYEVNYVMKDHAVGSITYTSKTKAVAAYEEFRMNPRCVRVFVVEKSILMGTFDSVTSNKKGKWN